jgi:hypothetical protein
MLFAELAKVDDEWLWYNGRIGSMLEVGFGKLVVEAKDRMENIAGNMEPTAWCGWLLGVRIVVKAMQNLAPSFFLTQGNGALFGAVISFTTLVHAVRGFECVRASAMIWCSASLVFLHKPLGW